MYPQNRTDQSYSYLKKVVEILDEPICILGGWAVYLTLNKQYNSQIKKDYPGSTDIDLGFHIEENATTFMNTAFRKALDKLEAEGFKEKGGRLFKALDYDNGDELTEKQAANKASYEINEMYVDMMVDCAPEKFNEEMKMDVFDEPFLNHAFENKNNRDEPEEFGKKLWLPKPWLLLATKVKALPNRQKDYKREKDILDIAGLLIFNPPEEIEKNWTVRIARLLQKKEILNTLNNIKSEEITRAEKMLEVQPNAFRTILLSFIREIQDIGVTNNVVDLEQVSKWIKHIDGAVKKKNIGALETVLATIRAKSAIDIFFNKEFRETILSILEQRPLCSPETANELVQLLLDMWKWGKLTGPSVDSNLVKHKESIVFWAATEGIYIDGKKAALKILLIIGETKEIINIVSKYEYWDNGYDEGQEILSDFSISDIQVNLDKGFLDDLIELAYEKMNEKDPSRFKLLYKALMLKTQNKSGFV